MDIYISLVGGSVIATQTEDGMSSRLAELVYLDVQEALKDVNLNGEVRHSVKVRMVKVELHK